MYAALKWEEEDRFNRLGKMLGVFWTREDAERFKEEDTQKRPAAVTAESLQSPMGVGDKLMIPLAFFFSPGLRDKIIRMFGQSHTGTKPEFAGGSQVVELGQLPAWLQQQLTGYTLPSDRVPKEDKDKK